MRQRLKLAAASPKLLDLYAADELTLEQLMAFCVSDDHARQEQVWDALQRGWSREPYTIRRMLTEDTVEAGDRRAVFVGVAAYEAAGGTVLRDLFQQDRGGWLQDVGLLDRLALEELEAEAVAIRAEGWAWVTVGLDFPYGHTAGLRRLRGEIRPLTDAEQATLDALRAEHDALTAAHEEAEELREAVDARLAELEAAIAAIDERTPVYDPAEVASAGAFVSVGHDGALRIERGLQAPGLGETAPAQAIAARHATWARQLPREPAALWAFLGALDADSRMALFAHCASLTLDAVQEPGSRRSEALADADRLAGAVGLDLVASGWAPTAANYLGRVTKAHILEAVREARGEAAVQLVDHLWKADMAREAERLLAGTGWLPEPLRASGLAADPVLGMAPLPAFLVADGDADEPAAMPEEGDDPYAIAAE